MLYKILLAVHFVAMIAVVGGAAAASLILSLVERGDPEAGVVYERAVTRVNRWLFMPGLAVAPIAGIWLWSRHSWVFPSWLQYKLGFTLLGLVGGGMYVHLFRTELRPMLRRRVGMSEGTGEAVMSCRRVVGASLLLLLAAAVIGTLKPGW